MKALIEKMQEKVSWLMPVQCLIVVFAMFMMVTVFSPSMRWETKQQAFFVPLFGFVIMTFAFFVGRSLRNFQKHGFEEKPVAWRLAFGPLRSSGEGDPDFPDIFDPPQSPGEEITPEEDEKEFRKRMMANRIDAASRNHRNMVDKVLHTGVVVAIFMVVYWFAVGSIADFFAALFGTSEGAQYTMFTPRADISFGSPKELFIFSWPVVLGVWFWLIVYLPRWLIYALLLATSGLRIVFLVFGPMASIWIMNMGQLPFFYGLMMIFMFGAILYPFIQAGIKRFRPGDATWETKRGSMRGQPEVRETMERELDKLDDYVAGRSKNKPQPGAVFAGSTGTGKTLYAREIATERRWPFMHIDGYALTGAPLLQLIINRILIPSAHSLSKEYGCCVVFIDEAETLLQARSGMQGASQPQSQITDIWDMFNYDSNGVVSSCGMAFDTEGARQRFWQLKSPLELGKNPKGYGHPFFFPIGMGGGGQNTVMPFLIWIDGAGSPPAMETLKRRLVNNFFDGWILFPTHIPSIKIPWSNLRFGPVPLRYGPAKPEKPLVFFIIATNRPWMLDQAITRPGRIGIWARFKDPGYEARVDITSRYTAEGVQKGFVHPNLLKKNTIKEAARSLAGMSPAQIEATVNTSGDVRLSHVKNMQRIKAQIDRGIPLRKLSERDRKYWLRNKQEIRRETWQDTRADLHALLEARNTVMYGVADPGLTTAQNREQTALHEYYGHFLVVKAALGKIMIPFIVSVLPRGTALGMVYHMQLEERDPKPQYYYEGLARTSLGGLVAERFFLGENQPGVMSDLENTTRAFCFITGRAAMTSYNCPKHPDGCPKEEIEEFVKIGEDLISVPDAPPHLLSPAQAYVEKMISGKSRERVAAMMGQAFVDDYRFIRATYLKHREFHQRIIAELLRLDEIGGARLERIWKQLGNYIVPWEDFGEEELEWWPDKIVHTPNYFYNPSRKSEAEELLL